MIITYDNNTIIVLDIVDTSWLVDDMAKNTIQHSMVIVTVHDGKSSGRLAASHCSNGG